MKRAKVLSRFRHPLTGWGLHETRGRSTSAWSRCRLWIKLYDRELAMLDPEVHHWLRDDAASWAVQRPPRRRVPMNLRAEIGDVHRFPTGGHLCSSAGLARSTSSRREGDPTFASSMAWAPGSPTPQDCPNTSVGCK
jgi:hypothetical protein